ncbi:hypothetical protein CPB86DRAFT_694937 [Serendipita vermifera]|nr:hypothetical protein CPB86DRAFT_694937 [Serendipita vermifera]
MAHRKIILYDIASKLNPQNWSPNVWKARYVLNYKGLPYETVYVPYPDISSLWEKLGLSPLDEGLNMPQTTLPVISVPSKDGGPPSVIAESFNIALFLDHEFPNTPRVIPENTAALQSSFVRTTLVNLLVTPIRPLVLPTVVHRLDERGAHYFRETREKAFGMKLEELTPPGEKRETRLNASQKSFTAVSEILSMNGDSHTSWVMGSVGPTFADFAIGGILRWIKDMGDEELWNTVSAWNGGRWKAHLDRLEPWSQVL